MIPDVAHHPIARQRQLGVLATVDSDDPGMMQSTIADDYEAVSTSFGWDLGAMERLSLDGIDACWAPEEEKSELRARFEREFATLRTEYGR